MLAVLLLFSELLNEIGVFSVSPLVMRIGTVCGVLCFLTPVLVLLRPLRVFRREAESLVYRKWHKYLILACTWLGTAAGKQFDPAVAAVFCGMKPQILDHLEHFASADNAGEERSAARCRSI